MKDRIPKYPGRVIMVPVPGQANTFDMVRADEPTEPGTPLNKATLLPDSTEIAIFGNAANRTVGEALGRVQRNMSAKLLYEKWTAGTFSWKCPAGVRKIGVMLGAAGGSGACFNGGFASDPQGGGAGELIQFILGVTPDVTHSGVIGQGGAGITVLKPAGTDYVYDAGLPGGSSSFAGETAQGGSGGVQNVTLSRGVFSGQAPDKKSAATTRLPPFAPYGGRTPSFDARSNGSSIANINTTLFFHNRFDLMDDHIYCGAGSSIDKDGGTAQEVATRAKGRAGTGLIATGSGTLSAENATAPGDGGGAISIICPTAQAATAISGAGADGFIRIYDLTRREEAEV